MEYDAEKELVSYIARALADEPDKVEVTLVEGEQSMILELRVAENDIGKIIGRQGRNANAMRVLLNAVALGNNKQRVVLEIVG